MSENKAKNNLDELEDFLHAVKLIGKAKLREHLPELNGILGKITDLIKLGSDGDIRYDFIDFEKFPETWGNDFLMPIVEAIAGKKVIEIYYQPFYEDKPYLSHVHPYLLREYRNRWYLIGLNDQKKELRTYGLDRIIKIRTIDKEYINRSFNASDYFRYTVGVISPAGEPPEVKIEVRKPQAYYFLTQPLHSTQGIDLENDEFIRFIYKVHPTYEFKSILLSYGSDLKVIEPEKLKNEMIEELKNSLDFYSGNA